MSCTANGGLRQARGGAAYHHQWRNQGELTKISPARVYFFTAKGAAGRCRSDRLMDGTMERLQREAEGRPFQWRNKWKTVWDEVTYCSERCRGQRHLPTLTVSKGKG